MMIRNWLDLAHFRLSDCSLCPFSNGSVLRGIESSDIWESVVILMIDFRVQFSQLSFTEMFLILIC